VKPLTRRTVLRGAGAAVAISACGPDFELKGNFPLGVASGEATASSVILWTMYRGKQPLKVKVTDEAGALVFEAEAPVENGDVAHVDVAGLTPYTRYEFQFFDGHGELSATGRFRTALPAGSRRPLTFGAVSCTKEGYDLAALSHAGGREDLDAFLLLGDTVYCDGADGIAEFRDKWRSGIADPNQQSLRASTSLIMTWDDHELFNNWDADEVPKTEFDNGLQAYFEHQPTRSGPLGQAIWRSHKWGDTAEVFVLDCRGERKPSEQIYLSRPQLDWLKLGLKNSTATFKLILNSVPISNFPGAFFATGTQDRWQGYPKQREELLSYIDDLKLRGVLWLSGDFHLGCVGRVSLQGPGQTQLEALVGPGGQLANPSPSYPEEPQFDWASGINNYTTLGLDPATGKIRIRYFDAAGKVIFDRTYEP
jgi:alkaline phosphatase D